MHERQAEIINQLKELAKEVDNCGGGCSKCPLTVNLVESDEYDYDVCDFLLRISSRI